MVLGGGQDASAVTTTDHRAGKFEAKFFDKVDSFPSNTISSSWRCLFFIFLILFHLFRFFKKKLGVWKGILDRLMHLPSTLMEKGTSFIFNLHLFLCCSISYFYCWRSAIHWWIGKMGYRDYVNALLAEFISTIDSHFFKKQNPIRIIVWNFNIFPYAIYLHDCLIGILRNKYQQILDCLANHAQFFFFILHW